MTSTRARATSLSRSRSAETATSIRLSCVVSCACSQPAGFLLHGVYNQGRLSDDVRSLEDLYRANGFEQVKITANVSDNYGGKANQLEVVLHVEEGPQTLVGILQIVGNTSKLDQPFPILNTLPNEPYSESLIADDRDIILNYYFNDGFPTPTSRPPRSPPQTSPIAWRRPAPSRRASGFP